MIGSPAVASASVTGSGSPKLSGQVWSVSGATPAYQSENVPTPSESPDGSTWGVAVNTSDFRDGNTFDFSWGEKPGVNTITFAATVTVFGNTENVEAEKKVYVGRPSINTRVQATGISYMWQGLHTGIGYRGVTWSFQSSTGGVFAVVQVINSGSNYSYISGGTTYSILGGATFPLLDDDGGSYP